MIMFIQISTSFHQELMSRADKDGTGSLDLIEFLGMMRDKIKEENKESEINEAFKVFDTVRVSFLFEHFHSQIQIQDGNGYTQGARAKTYIK